MRVIQLCNFDRPHAGSFVPMVLSVLRHARDRGWDATAVFPRSARDCRWVEDFADQGIEVHLAGPGDKLTLTRRLSYLLWEHEGPTVLHTHFTLWDVPAVLAARRRPETTVFWHVHSTLPDSLRAKTRNVSKFATLGRMVGGILCPAENIAEGVRGRGAPDDKVVFFPSAVDTDALPALDADARAQARAELGLPQQATVLLHFGWHWHLKGGDIFLGALRMLLDDGPRDLLAIERGAGEHGEAEIARLELTDSARIVPPVEDVQTLFGAADLLVASSRSEGMAYSVLESLCSGTPVVATRVPGHAYLGERVEACHLVDFDPASVAAGVRSALALDSSEREGQVQRTRDWIVGNLGLGSCAEKLLEIYERGSV